MEVLTVQLSLPPGRIRSKISPQIRGALNVRTRFSVKEPKLLSHIHLSQRVAKCLCCGHLSTHFLPRPPHWSNNSRTGILPPVISQRFVLNDRYTLGVAHRFGCGFRCTEAMHSPLACRQSGAKSTRRNGPVGKNVLFTLLYLSSFCCGVMYSWSVKHRSQFPTTPIRFCLPAGLTWRPFPMLVGFLMFVVWFFT